jgi:hypothetical protein
MVMNSSAALSQSGQPHQTLNGVRTMRMASTTIWSQKQPRPGPRAASRGSPLYETLRTVVGGLSGAGRGDGSGVEELTPKRYGRVADHPAGAPLEPFSSSPGHYHREVPPDPRFAWHPEPELIAITDEKASRPALERLGADAWRTALDYLYDEALRRAIGEPAGYEELRRVFFGPDGSPAAAPETGQPSAEVLAEFTRRLAPHQLNAWHPRTLSYPFGCRSSASCSPRSLSRASTSGTPGRPAPSSRRRSFAGCANSSATGRGHSAC